VAILHKIPLSRINLRQLKVFNDKLHEHNTLHNRTYEMTKALEEQLIIEAKHTEAIKKIFSKENLEKVKKYNTTKRAQYKRVKQRVLSVNDIF